MHALPFCFACAQEEWDTDSVFVSNKTHDKYTELLIKGEPEKPGVRMCGKSVD